MERVKEKIVIGSINDVAILVSEESRNYIASVQIRQTGGGAIAEAMEDTRIAHAEHLVECWNGYEEGGLVEQLQQQRDVLLKVCKVMLIAISLTTPDAGEAVGNAETKMKQAIASAEGIEG